MKKHSWEAGIQLHIGGRMSKPMYLNVRMSCLASFLSFEKKTIALELNSSATSRSSTRLSLLHSCKGSSGSWMNVWPLTTAVFHFTTDFLSPSWCRKVRNLTFLSPSPPPGYWPAKNADANSPFRFGLSFSAFSRRALVVIPEETSGAPLGATTELESVILAAFQLCEAQSSHFASPSKPFLKR